MVGSSLSLDRVFRSFVHVFEGLFSASAAPSLLSSALQRRSRPPPPLAPRSRLLPVSSTRPLLPSTLLLLRVLLLVLREEVRGDLLLLLLWLVLLLLLRVTSVLGILLSLVLLLLLLRSLGVLLLRRGSVLLLLLLRIRLGGVALAVRRGARLRWRLLDALLWRLHAVSSDTARSRGHDLFLRRRRLLRAGRDVQTPVDDSRDRLNLGPELLLDAVQVESVLVRDQVDRESEMSVSSRATDSVQVRLGVLGEIKVDDDVDGLDIDTTREEICSRTRRNVSIQSRDPREEADGGD